MTETALAQIEALSVLSLPRVSSMDWDPSTAKVALQGLRRVQGELDAFQAVLIGVLKTETGRDTKATLARGFGMSTAEARKADTVSKVVGRVVGAQEALMNGEVSVEHLLHLKSIADNVEAAELLALAPSQSPDDFGKLVARYLIDRDAKGVRERQHKSRSLKFFKADNGCVGSDSIDRWGDHEVRTVPPLCQPTTETCAGAARRRVLLQTRMPCPMDPLRCRSHRRMGRRRADRHRKSATAVRPRLSQAPPRNRNGDHPTTRRHLDR